MTSRSDQLLERQLIFDLMERLMGLVEVSCTLGDTEDVPSAINDPAAGLYQQITEQYGDLQSFVYRVTERFDPVD